MLNNVCLQGRLTKEPEIKNTSNQVAYANFTIACERDFKDSNGNKTSDFINCVAWRNTATFIGSYFHKGDMIVVNGKVQTRSYDGNDGKKVYVTEILVESANFCGNSGGGNSNANANAKPTNAPTPKQAPVYQEVEESSEELPFDI